MALYTLDGHRVETPASGRFWVADNAAVIGRVTLGEDASVWFGATIRGDNEPIRVGDRTSIQDGAVLHVDPGFPMDVGADCVIGHLVMLHGCTVGRGSLVGIGAVVLNGARIGEECLIGAKALIPEGREIPPRSLVLGSPGKIVRELTQSDVERIRQGAANYQRRVAQYQVGLKRQA